MDSDSIPLGLFLGPTILPPLGYTIHFCSILFHYIVQAIHSGPDFLDYNALILNDYCLPHSGHPYHRLRPIPYHPIPLPLPIPGLGCIRLIGLEFWLFISFLGWDPGINERYS